MKRYVKRFPEGKPCSSLENEECFMQSISKEREECCSTILSQRHGISFSCVLSKEILLETDANGKRI